MEALRLAKDMGNVEVLWVLRHVEKEQTLYPYAVCIMTTKQLIIPAKPGSLQLM